MILPSLLLALAPQMGEPFEVHPSGASQTWCFVAQGPNEVQFAFHAAQDVWLATWDVDLQGQTRFQRVNTLVQKQQDEVEIDRCPVTGRYFVHWSDRYGNYAVSMMSVGRIFEADGTPIGPEFVLSDTPDSAWQPKAAPHPKGGWVVTHTRDWGEDSEVVRVSPDGEVNSLGLMHPKTGASENYPAIRMGPGGDYVGAYRLDNTHIMLRGTGMAGGVSIGTGWDPNLGRGEIVWQSLDNKEVWRRPITADGRVSGPAELVAFGRDSESDGRWMVWENRADGVIEGRKDGGDTQVLSQWLGITGPYQSDRRKPKTSTYLFNLHPEHRGRTILAYAGRDASFNLTAYARVIENGGTE